jgi:carbon-monoxide dehydrogenase medium subunit
MYAQRPAEFTYHRATSLEEAVRLLGADGDTRILAGGHSLLPLMKTRLVSPSALVDIGRIPGLAEIAEDGEAVRVGALATHATVAGSQLVRSRCPMLAETAGLIGDPQVRNRGTIGGSLAHADPGADYPTAIKALRGTITAAGPDGRREIAADDFFVGVFTTALRQGELLASVRVPALVHGTGAAYVKHRHPASGYAVAAAAAVVSVDGGSCTEARLVIGGVTSMPEVAKAAGSSLIGIAPVDEAAILTAAEKVADVLDGALGDTYASPEYRVHLATVLARRAVTEAMRRASS